jgi:transcriptional regulator with XRE-family HTH domain
MEAKEFRRRRIRLGVTQTELAEMLDVQPNTVSRYETGTLAISKVVELALEAIEYRMAEKEELIEKR